MADPFSATASTASFVSLGIQVCGGLIGYCRAWRSHDKEIEQTLERLTDLELGLKELSSILSNVECLDDSITETLHGARQKIRSCAAALNKLHGALLESVSFSQPSSVLDKLHNARLRSMSFFNKEKLNGIRGAIAETRANLDSAISTLNVHLTIKSNLALQNLAKEYKNTALQVPNAIEIGLIEHLGAYTRRVDMLKQDLLDESTSQHNHILQRLEQHISALKLGMMQKPTVIQSTYEQVRQLQSQHSTLQSLSLQRCTCRAYNKHRSLTNAKRSRHSENPASQLWNTTAFTSTLFHRRNCPLSVEAQEARQFGLRISFSGPLLRGILQAMISMTCGSGGFSISPMLSFIPTISCDAGAFKILDFRFQSYSSAADMQATFAIKMQELRRLYLEGKASPRDMDEQGNNVLHKACQIADIHSPAFTMDSNAFEIYFQFLRDLYEMGVPLNSTNAMGLTPLGLLVLEYYLLTFIGKLERLVTLLSLKMLDLGAEFPLFTQKTIRPSSGSVITIGQQFALCPDLAEAVGCNDISQAILAKSWPLLTAAIHRNPQSINQPNALGQTSLHFSVEWPESIRVLLKAGAAIDVTDHFGFSPCAYAAKLILLEPLEILGDAGCALYKSPNRYQDIGVGSWKGSLLKLMMHTESFEQYWWYRLEGSKDDAVAVVDAVIRLVAERRRTLTTLLRSSLDGQVVNRLELSPETVLDHKTSVAMSMLQRENIHVPNVLKRLSPHRSTVYHIRCLTLRQARSLWTTGFRDIDELDRLGQSPLMKDRYFFSKPSFSQTLEIVEWLRLKGADLHRRQGHAFQQILSGRNDTDERIEETDRASGVTAAHYLASHLGQTPHKSSTNERIQNLRHKIPALTKVAAQVLRTILSDPLPDCCTCACSTGGCSTYIMLAKVPQRMASVEKNESISWARRESLRITQALFPLLNVDHPSQTWLRRQIIRFNTFVKLRLRHTCCQMFYGAFGKHIIVELDDEDDRCEIREEQAAQVERLEALCLEFEKKYNESRRGLSEFLDGYWKDRMGEIEREEAALDQVDLDSIGVTLRRCCQTSSHSSLDETEDRIHEMRRSDPADMDDSGEW